MALRKNKVIKGKGRGAGSKFVLFVGDEGSILVYIKNNAVVRRQFVPDAAAQNLKELQATLALDTQAPLLLVIDSMDQSFAQQTLPPVSSLSVKKLVNRRLERDFASSEIKGALMLGREASGRKDWNFLLVALDKTPQLAAWLDFASELPNRFEGICLASVESEMIVQDLQRAISGSKEGSGAVWTFFVSHNKVGGFRQVILKNGRIMFTRMTQPVGETNPEVIAGNIEQEMLNTIEYIRRLSFDPKDGLDIFIIASSAIRHSLDKARFGNASFTVLTPFEAAKHLGIIGATQNTDQFGDVMIAAAIGCSKHHVLTLSTTQSRQLSQMQRIFVAQRAIMTGIVMGTAFFGLTVGYDIIATGKNLRLLETKKTELLHVREETGQSGLNIETDGDIFDLYQRLEQEKASPLPFIARLAATLHPQVSVKAIDWSLVEGERMTAILTLQFAPSSFSETSARLLQDVKAAFKGYEVTYSQMPSGFSESDKLDVTFGNNKPVVTSGNPIEVKLAIRGETGLPQEVK